MRVPGFTGLQRDLIDMVDLHAAVDMDAMQAYAVMGGLSQSMIPR